MMSWALNVRNSVLESTIRDFWIRGRTFHSSCKIFEKHNNLNLTQNKEYAKTFFKHS